MRSWFGLVLVAVGVAVALFVPACGAPHRAPVQHAAVVDSAPHKAAIAALVKPLVDAQIVSGMVIGLYDAGKTEVYGFGKGPGNRAPDGFTLFEIGSVTRVFTGLLLADAVQRQEVTLQTELADLVPPGVTVPIRDNQPITLGMLATHTSGLPRQPPSLAAKVDSPDPYDKYGEEAMYSDLIRSPLVDTPGTKVVFSSFGAGVLGFVLGRKLGVGYPAALEGRVLQPLGLGSTYLAVPEGAKVRRATGTNADLKPVPYWYFDALAGAGALVSDAHDLLALIDAELDAASGSKEELRPAMHFTQEPQLDHPEGDNEGLGWQIDTAGRYWHTGQTGGFHAFVGFDPKTRRGVVILTSTALQIFDHLAADCYKVLAGEPTTPVKLPTAEQMAPFVGTYTFSGEQLAVSMKGDRLYITGHGAPPFRLVPLSANEMWLEPLSAVVGFQRQGGKVTRAVFLVGDQQLVAPRLPDAAAAPTPAPVAPEPKPQ